MISLIISAFLYIAPASRNDKKYTVHRRYDGGLLIWVKYKKDK